MSFKDKFNDFFRTADTTDEWVYSKFIDSLLKEIDATGAFRMIPEVVEFLLEQSNKDLRFELLEVLISLAHETNTTEIPAFLQNKMTVLEDLFVGSDYERSRFNELKRLYRIQSEHS